MRYLLITSRITYIPDNSINFYEKLLKTEKKSISHVVFVENFSFYIIKKIFLLYTVGAYSIATNLLKNIFSLFYDKRANLCKNLNIPTTSIHSTKDLKLEQVISEHKIDVIINFRSREIVPENLLKLPKLGWINIHHGILPKQRGLFCDLYALFLNQPVGFSIHKMNSGIDEGEIYTTHYMKNSNTKNYCTYLKNLALPEAEELIKLMETINQLGTLPYGKKNTGDDIIINRTPSYIQIKKMIEAGVSI